MINGDALDERPISAIIMARAGMFDPDPGPQVQVLSIDRKNRVITVG